MQKTLILALVATILFGLASVAIAHPRGEPDYAKLQAELRLTDAQLAAFKAERERHHAAMRAHREEAMAQGRQLHEAHHDKLGKVLSAEQMAQLKAMRDGRREEMRKVRKERGEERRNARRGQDQDS